MGYLGGVPVDPGRDANRPQGVRACTLHRTTGSWPGDYSVGKNRLHSTPGTFNVLLGAGHGEWVSFYWFDTRCSHAAGGNYAGPGIEISGENGSPLTDWQLDALTWCLAAAHNGFGVPYAFYDGEVGRVWLDQHPYSGFITHRAITYPPNRSYDHYDYISRAEWDACGLRLLAQAPPPKPVTPKTRAQIVAALREQNRWRVRYTSSPAAAVTPRDEVLWWQQALNATTGARVPEDGRFDLHTLAATIDFNRFFRVRKYRRSWERIVDNKTRRQMIRVLNA